MWVVVGTAGRLAFQVPTNKYPWYSPPTVMLTEGPYPRHPRGGPIENNWSGRRTRTRNWEICVLGLGHSTLVLV